MSNSCRYSDKISKLTPTQFENLIYDCVRSMGVRNLVWRTPGSDGGRDIEGIVIATDILGVDKSEKWYVECKKYKRSIDWPTLWNKIAYADSQCADVFLLATNSNPSPSCENEVSNWNNLKKRPTIRVLRGYEISEILSTKSHILMRHGIAEKNDQNVDKGFLKMSRLILGIVQSAHAEDVFSGNRSTALEVASILTELLEQRLSDISQYGRFGSGHMCSQSIPSPPDWLVASGDYSKIEEISYLSSVAALLHFSRSSKISTIACGNSFSFRLERSRYAINEGSSGLMTVLELACGEFVSVCNSTYEGRINFWEGV